MKISLEDLEAMYPPKPITKRMRAMMRRQALEGEALYKMAVYRDQVSQARGTKYDKERNQDVPLGVETEMTPLEMAIIKSIYPFHGKGPMHAMEETLGLPHDLFEEPWSKKRQAQ